MGSLTECATKKTVLLHPEHLIGRARACTSEVAERYVSAQHALLRWTGQRWELKDLGSRNGTFIDGARLKPGEDHPVRRGTRLAFGKVSHEWELVDDSSPQVMAVPIDGGPPRVMEGELLALPSSDDPEVTIYRATDGSWILEQLDELTPIAHLAMFSAGGRTWRFSSPESVQTTSLATGTTEIQVRDLSLSFSVSRDEEHVHLQASCKGKTFDLGARTAHYLLLTLARRLLADADEGQSETARGWVYQADLAHDPSMAPPQLNIDVFRLRRQIAACGVVDAANIVERRPSTRQLRIGTGRISIVSV
ncbi:MAG TPA: FHA domain-containing protein [Polyangiaceae bacterium]